MQYRSLTKYAFVRNTDVALFEEELNAKIDELRSCRPEVTFSETGDYLIARIKYTEDIVEPENAADRFELEHGIRFTCGDCPHFRPMLRPNGEVDNRCKFGDCDFAQLGRTSKSAKACDYFYKQLREGRIRLCLSE